MAQAAVFSGNIAFTNRSDTASMAVEVTDNSLRLRNTSASRMFHFISCRIGSKSEVDGNFEINFQPCLFLVLNQGVIGSEITGREKSSAVIFCEQQGSRCLPQCGRRATTSVDNFNIVAVVP